MYVLTVRQVPGVINPRTCPNIDWHRAIFVLHQYNTFFILPIVTLLCWKEKHTDPETMRQSSFLTSMLLALSQLSVLEGFQVAKSPLSIRPTLHRQPQTFSPLFQEKAKTPKSNNPFREVPRSLSSKFDLPRRKSLQLWRRLRTVRKSVLSFALALCVSFTGIRTEPAVAATAAVAPQDGFEKVVDQYVQKHMFDDDVYEPVESVYREAVADKVQGSHPKALSEITSSVLGQDGIKIEKSSSSSGIGDLLLKAISFLQQKGLSESMAIIILTGSFVVAGPVAFLIGGMMVGSQSKRQINSVMKKRYGDTYT